MANIETKIVIVWIVCSLLIASGFVIIFSPSSADVVALQSTIEDIGEHVWAEAVRIGPSPFLLFSMGALGLGCVVINERLRHYGKPD